MRFGAQTLLLLAVPLNSLVLRSLSMGPKDQAELRREADSPAQSTLRTQLKKLEEIGTITRQKRNRFPGAIDYELAPAGQGLLFVAGIVERWLANAPNGPLALGENAAKAAIRSLSEGWSTAMVRALASRPLSLTELDGIIGSLSYPSLERRLGAMKFVGQVKPCPGGGRSTPHIVTDWLREGVAPLVTAARWERHYLPRAARIGRLDIEAVFLLTAPLLRLPADLSGTCWLAAEMPDEKKPRLAGSMVEVKNGAVVSCVTQLQGRPDAWALGPPAAWLSALVEHDRDGLELGGNGHLARALIGNLHDTLFKYDIGNVRVRSLG
jgi:DNA-binding HxlR family transcriptional regulator